MKYLFKSAGQKSDLAIIEASSIEEALEKFGGVDDVIESYQRFKTHYFSGVYTVHIGDNPNCCKVVHSTRVLSGYGYHGGGRPAKGEDARRVTCSISGTKAEIEQLKEKAKESGKTVSRFVLDNLAK